jgi:hypothetical protein
MVQAPAAAHVPISFSMLGIVGELSGFPCTVGCKDVGCGCAAAFQGSMGYCTPLGTVCMLLSPRCRSVLYPCLFAAFCCSCNSALLGPTFDSL